MGHLEEPLSYTGHHDDLVQALNKDTRWGWVGRPGRICLESKDFMLVKISGAINSYDNQDSKVKQQEHRVIGFTVVEVNSMYLFDSHHANVLISRFILLPARSVVLHRGQCLVTFLTVTLEECCWHLVGGGQGSAKHRTVHRAAPPTRKNYLD